jgi:NDP-4-keto-2,6-dideoxyhexose 3-C-methyltransferase
MGGKTVYKKVEKCRICGNTNLQCVLDLGEQMLTGVFPRAKDVKVTTGPLRLVKCVGDNNVCGLLQLEHSYDLGEMYGENYGYRSGLNPSMVTHLHNKVKRILGQVELSKGDLVVDIGSNDSTTLQAYPTGPILVGIDPTGIKFSSYYPTHIHLIPDFFSAAVLRERFPGKKAKVITSFSMLYDLEDPISFMREVHEMLADDGIWMFEQSYMPTMLETNSYDTVCHEHLEFYAVRQIKWMADRVGFRILDVEFNNVNGGSFSIIVSKAGSDSSVAPSVQKILDHELEMGLDTLTPYQAFAKRVAKSKWDLLEFIETARTEGKTVAALGASTKGNVLLQYCGLTARDIPFIGEVNSDKFGSYAPGTWIPIIAETELLAMKPDYLIVLPWHFRKFFEENTKYSNCNLIFPLPELGHQSGSKLIYRSSRAGE